MGLFWSSGRNLVSLFNYLLLIYSFRCNWNISCNGLLMADQKEPCFSERERERERVELNLEWGRA
jgi:hypothetical protein